MTRNMIGKARTRCGNTYRDEHMKLNKKMWKRKKEGNYNIIVSFVDMIDRSGRKKFTYKHVSYFDICVCLFVLFIVLYS